MNPADRLRNAIASSAVDVRRLLPEDRAAALAAVVASIDRQPSLADSAAVNLVSGHRFAHPGANRALQFCLEPGTPSDTDFNAGRPRHDWAERLLTTCAALDTAGMVLDHAATGFMQLAARESGNIDAWITTRRSPVSWRERADFGWWAAWSQANPDPVISGGTPAVRAGPPEERAAGMVDRMAYQFGYPADAVLAGIPVAVILDVLRTLIARTLSTLAGHPLPRSEPALIADLAATVPAPADVIARTLAGFTLEPAGAAWHAAVPGIATAPLVRLDREHVFLCRAGLTSEPLLFLTRELRRRDATAITASAHLREDVFRRDLYGLFADRRFVTSTSRIQLRHAGGNLRTDIDAAIFDRKTAALGLFELKSQDPFARSLAERTRQRDNLLYAGRQISAILDWINRHGADEILNRIDRETAKRFRVQKVVPFVLGRYLARFDDGPTPDRRAAWGTWPHLLRLRDGQPVGPNEPRPLTTIHARLSQDMTAITIPPETPPQEVRLDATRLTVYPSLNTWRAACSRDQGY